MELLSPAGNLEKLATAYRYGADAAYIGVEGFSLRTYANAIPEEDPETVGARLRSLRSGGRRLYAALNLFAHDHDLQRLPAILERLAVLPIDAVIIADIGLIDAVRRALPAVELHLSTQANCTNAAAARVYRTLGFDRIIPARELALDEVKRIKDAVPELGIEVFGHGALCMAYSGRCFMSDVLAGRSANRGDCAQSCRWNYRVEHFRLEEEKRPGEWIPVEDDGRFLSVLSSRDLNLFDHVADLQAAGVDAVKIEGRMKSALYVAVTTRSYRAAIDAVASGTESETLRSPEPEVLAAHREELFRVAHRPYTTGFLFGDRAVHRPTTDTAPARYRLMGILDAPRDGARTGAVPWQVTVKNTIHRGMELQFLPPDSAGPTEVRDREFALLDADGASIERLTNVDRGAIVPSPSVQPYLQPGTIIRCDRPDDAGTARTALPPRNSQGAPRGPERHTPLEPYP